MRLDFRSLAFMPWLIITGLLVLVDQGTKAIVRAFLYPGSRLPLIDGFLYVTLVQNYRGFSWFVPTLPLWVHLAFFILRVVIVMMAFPVYRFYSQTVPESRWAGVAVFGVSAGVLGNLTDGLFLPYTTDFLQVFGSPSANFADLYAYIGVAALGVETIAWFHLCKPKWRGFRHFLAERTRIWKAFFKFLRGSWTGK